MSVILTDRLEFGRLLELAGRNSIGEFRVSADSFPRLKTILADGQPGELHLRIAFSLVDENRPQLDIQVRGQLGLVCQRCLDRLEWPVDLDVSLALVSDEDEADQLPDPFDSVEVPTDGLWLPAAAEDEILAAVPIAAVHADRQRCAAAAAPDATDGRSARPFASLRDLMEQQRGDGKPN